MPQFDLRGIKAAKYNNNGGTITYTNKTDVGDAMTANLELRFAEGRLYAESALAEYLKEVTGWASSTSRTPPRRCCMAPERRAALSAPARRRRRSPPCL